MTLNHERNLDRIKMSLYVKNQYPDYKLLRYHTHADTYNRAIAAHGHSQHSHFLQNISAEPVKCRV